LRNRSIDKWRAEQDKTRKQPLEEEVDERRKNSEAASCWAGEAESRYLYLAAGYCTGGSFDGQASLKPRAVLARAAEDQSA
jgi:hypothetical protein